MAGRTENSVAGYFGKQIRKERLKAGWSITELARRMGMDDAHLGRIERGVRPPTAETAAKADEAFPGRDGWFLDYYQESRSWVPAAFKAWQEYEDRAARLYVWSPGILHGLVQTPAYARAVLSASPGVTDEVVTARLTARLERQRRVLMRDDPPMVWFIVDQLSLYREVGSPSIMADQMTHLAEVANLPNVTLTVMPAVVHPANESGFVIADGALYAEHVAAGGVYDQDQTVSSLVARFASLQAESYRASESLRAIERLGQTWQSGASPLTQAVTAGTA
jgi:transcriptional regulator with XRE-family HTH domain